MGSSEEVGKRVREMREARKIKQGELAARIEGMSQSRLSALELGQQRWTVELLAEVAAALDASPHDLLPPDERAGPAVLNNEERWLLDTYRRTRGNLRAIINTALDMIEVRKRSGGSAE